MRRRKPETEPRFEVADLASRPPQQPPAWLRAEVFEAYLRWCEACAAGALAYERWREAAREHRADAFARFSRALDEEERRASAYAGMVIRATDYARALAA